MPAQIFPGVLSSLLPPACNREIWPGREAKPVVQRDTTGSEDKARQRSEGEADGAIGSAKDIIHGLSAKLHFCPEAL